MTDTMVLHIIETCHQLKILHLPFNARIAGWFLETLIEMKKKSPALKLEMIKMFINTAYIDLQHVIPEPYAASLVNSLLELNINIDISFVNKKLMHFNPKDL